jgi:RimJ/RimL family protein N-acetyltransferase/catechol 2,3-dioxygenase-like lactoylglutathione lyase family enzyme
MTMLRTARLVLSPLCEDDGDALHSAYSDAETLRYWHQPVTTSVEESRERARQEAEGGAAVFAIREAEGQDAVGFVGFVSSIAPNHQSAFGYLLRKEHWGKGYVVEAAQAVLDHGFADLGVVAAELWIYEGNDRSRRVAEKLGATYRGMNVSFNLLMGGVRRTYVYEIRRADALLPPEVVRATPIVRVGDLEAGVAWYRDNLGFKLEWSTPVSASMVSSGWLPNAAVIRLTPGDARPSRVAFAVPTRIDELAADVGATAEDMPWGMRTFAVTDPWGNELVFESVASRQPG